MLWHQCLYGSDTWTLTAKLNNELDGCYTWMLRTILNIHRNQGLTIEELYGDLQRKSEKIRRRRLKFSGHCRRSKGEMAPQLVLWTPKHGHRKQGRPTLTYIDTQTKDANLNSCRRARRLYAGQDMCSIEVNQHSCG